MKWAEELGSGQKNIRKYAPLYFESSEIEIHSGEEFIFSITYRDPKEFELAENMLTSRDQVGTKSALSWDQVGTKSKRNKNYFGNVFVRKHFDTDYRFAQF